MNKNLNYQKIVNPVVETKKISSICFRVSSFWLPLAACTATSSYPPLHLNICLQRLQNKWSANFFMQIFTVWQALPLTSVNIFPRKWRAGKHRFFRIHISLTSILWLGHVTWMTGARLLCRPTAVKRFQTLDFIALSVLHIWLLW